MSSKEKNDSKGRQSNLDFKNHDRFLQWKKKKRCDEELASPTNETASDQALGGKTHHCAKRYLSFMSGNHNQGMFPSCEVVTQGQPFNRNYSPTTCSSALSVNTYIIIKSINIS